MLLILWLDLFRWLKIELCSLAPRPAAALSRRCRALKSRGGVFLITSGGGASFF
jgi:hypothetical protein